jgi:hypothetical protein
MPRELKPCGTHAAYCRHIQRGEQPCAPCKAAHAAYEAAVRAANPERHRRAVLAYQKRRKTGEVAHVDPCGTPNAYHRHRRRRRREEPCPACQAAWSEYCRLGHLRRKEAANASA